MKISGRKNVNNTGAINKAVDPQKSDAQAPAEQSAGTGKGDNIDISTTSRQLSNAKEIVANTPDTRIEKVSEIKLQIGDGQYYVESEKIAKKMVNESLSESAARRK
jgi:flagellar biosynthesis anti-sigma factor FlgM